jgi:hypothetical protein
MSGIRSDAIKLSTGRGFSQRPGKESGMPSMVRIVAAVALVLATGAAFAQDVASVYSSTDVRKCKKIDAAKEGEGDWTVWLCAGIGGRVVLVSEDDLRMTVSIARDRKSAGNQPAASQGFSPFNRIHDTLEWRTAKGQPFATIQRWFLSDSANPGKDDRPTPVGMLVVTRLHPACHAAYIDVAANGGSDANVLARQAADEHARGFNCKQQPVIVGKSGRAIELARLGRN